MSSGKAASAALHTSCVRVCLVGGRGAAQQTMTNNQHDFGSQVWLSSNVATESSDMSQGWQWFHVL